MMALISMLAADVDPDFFRAAGGMGRGSGLVLRDVLLILAVVLVLVGLLVVWAKYLRGSGRSHHHHHRRHHRRQAEPDETEADESATEVESRAVETVAATSDDAGEGAAQPHRHHRQKIHRREHRPRNPTLAETGGLPPVRDEKTPPLFP